MLYYYEFLPKMIFYEAKLNGEKRQIAYMLQSETTYNVNNVNTMLYSVSVYECSEKYL